MRATCWPSVTFPVEVMGTAARAGTTTEITTNPGMAATAETMARGREVIKETKAGTKAVREMATTMEMGREGRVRETAAMMEMGRAETGKAGRENIPEETRGKTTMADMTETKGKDTMARGRVRTTTKVIMTRATGRVMVATTAMGRAVNIPEETRGKTTMVDTETRAKVMMGRVMTTTTTKATTGRERVMMATTAKATGTTAERVAGRRFPKLAIGSAPVSQTPISSWDIILY